MAEDEDSPSSVYLVFDPETGDFAEVKDTKRKRKHVAIQESVQEGTGSAAPVSGDISSEGGKRSPLIAGGAAVVGLMLLVVAGRQYLARNKHGQ
jgi:hypothetical protein